MFWRWVDLALFGEKLPEESPAGLWRFVYNLRFPGQTYDAESGLHYNYFRDYNPWDGRYLQSDPIGLAGGINTYAYANGNPATNFDFFGLSADDVVDIIKKIKDTTEEMTKKGFRHPNRTINNSCRYWKNFPGCKVNKYKECSEQTEHVNDYLSKGKYQDRWAFYEDFGFGHHWGIAVSNNPKDPVITYDVRANDIGVGKDCDACHGWFGDREYGANNPPGPAIGNR